ncbi:procathepsin L-like [Littorina saxatilis]|uniref:Uncharacterized protein n=1 Tax=Littorina saxatilis TaxID=31220 RepID=A0AAN9GGR2_9CAEN
MRSPFVLVALLLVQKSVAKNGNYSLHENANQELSAAALNVKVSFAPYEETWSNFKVAYGRQYSSKAVEAYRFQTFVSNLKKIEQHNSLFQNGNTTYWMGINQFADMSVEEYRAHNKLKPVKRTASRTLKCLPFQSPLNYQLPATVDWRKKGYVTPVKNQGQCGSCWAFSTTGSMEGQYYRKTKSLVSLSEQQLVDCAGPFGTQGCNGGDEPLAYAYINNAGGIDKDIDYPYESQDGQCRFLKNKVVARVTGCYDVTEGSEQELQSAVSSQGPVSVNIDANHDSFQFYSGGVYVEQSCQNGPEDLDHAVLAVGYGTMGGQDYWIVKNSWGGQWGLQGYIMMARNKNNMCGVATEANFPVVSPV